MWLSVQAAVNKIARGVKSVDTAVKNQDNTNTHKDDKLASRMQTFLKEALPRIEALKKLLAAAQESVQQAVEFLACPKLSDSTALFELFAKFTKQFDTSLTKLRRTAEHAAKQQAQSSTAAAGGKAGGKARATGRRGVKVGANGLQDIIAQMKHSGGALKLRPTGIKHA
ncbi:MAG: hypothetical protein MHM6MM_008583 [Cercozoa sp. M6MM]